MRKCRKLLAAALAIIMCASVLIFPASALKAKTTGGAQYPTVFVHGLFGWGEYDKINSIVPYWGMTTGSITDYLTLKGYKDCHMASVGPLSSAWDRACELYAQITGTRVDYGAAHAAKYGHARYGRDYSTYEYGKLIPGYNWSAENKINLVGHSFGGATTRLLLDLLADGNADEQTAAPDDCSPLFKGGKADWVYSLTAIAAPSNGTTFIEANPDVTKVVTELFYSASKALGVSNLKGVYDFQLEQYGIYKSANETMSQALARVLNSDFLKHNDNAIVDLTIDKALDINAGIQMQPNVYYFSFYGNRTTKSPVTGNAVPTVRMFSLLQPFGFTMGKYVGTTRGYYEDGYGTALTTVDVKATYTDKTWQPSDGMVNVVSGMYPWHYVNGVKTADKNVGFTGTKGLVTGQWYVMPAQDFDHLGIVGGMLNESPYQVHKLYDSVMANIAACGK